LKYVLATMECALNSGNSLKYLSPLILLLSICIGCSSPGDIEPGLGDPRDAPAVLFAPDVHRAALLAASRGATANRLLKEALGATEDQNLCDGLITHNRRLHIKPTNKPVHREYYRDELFGTRSMRITDSPVDEVRKPIHSSVNAWNADESLILLHRYKADKHDYLLLDGHSYEVLKSLDIPASNVQDVFWSHTDPETLFYVSKGSDNKGWFIRYNVRLDDHRRVRNFASVCGTAVPSSGLNVQMQSLDNDLFGFRCETPTGHAMLSYRLSSNTFTHAPIGQGTAWESDFAPMPAPSGDVMEMQGKVLTPQLENPLHSLDQAAAQDRSSLGRTSDGKDALYQTTFDPSPAGCDGSEYAGVAHLTEFDLDSGQCRAVVSQAQGWPYTTKGTHVSALARYRQGWVAMSSVGYGNFGYFDDPGKAPALTSEIYLVNTDPEDTQVCRLMHHRSHAKEAGNAEYPAQLGEPHVTISPSGTRILFASDWYDSGSVDTHVIELPAYTNNYGLAEFN